MEVTLNKAEKNTLKSLDPKGKGERPWQNARELASVVYRKKEENLDQDQIRVVRNALRKPVREGLVEMSGTERGKYRISDKGRKLLASGKTTFTSAFDRGKAAEAAKAMGQARMKTTGRKKAKPKKAAKKVAKKKPAKKAAKKAKAKKTPQEIAAKHRADAKKKAAKKTTKKAAKKPADKKESKAKIPVEDRSKESKAAAKGANGKKKKKNSGRKGPPTFKRRNVASSYSEQDK